MSLATKEATTTDLIIPTRTIDDVKDSREGRKDYDKLKPEENYGLHSPINHGEN